MGEFVARGRVVKAGAGVFAAVRQRLGCDGTPRFRSVKRGWLAAKDGNVALRPNTDPQGRLAGLPWRAECVTSIAAPADKGRRGEGQQAEPAELEGLIAAGQVLSTCGHATGRCAWRRSRRERRTVMRRSHSAHDHPPTATAA